MADVFGLSDYTPSGYGSTWGTGNGLAAAGGGGGGGGASMWLQAGGALLTGIFGGSSQKKQQKRQFKYDWRLQEGAGVIDRKNMRYQMELQRYLERLGKQDKERGLKQFKQFSTVGQFAPNYQDTSQPIQVPTIPDPSGGVYQAENP